MIRCKLNCATYLPLLAFFNDTNLETAISSVSVMCIHLFTYIYILLLLLLLLLLFACFACVVYLMKDRRVNFFRPYHFVYVLYPFIIFYIPSE